MTPRKLVAAEKDAEKTPKALLKRYREKRDFAKTAEPSGEELSERAAGFSYMIQKHAATRLHYDFRLELDGVMKSWAVTRGPSLNPADKRLSVHVEDHPISYSTFEGTIPQGEYGGGTVMLWDRGSWEPLNDPHEGYRSGNLKFLLHGERLQGEWHLIRMHGHRKEDSKHDNWLLMKHADPAADTEGEKAIATHVTSVATGRTMPQIAANGRIYHSNADPLIAKGEARPAKPRAKKALAAKAKAAMPEFVELQLATLVDAPPAGKDWIHEIKFDGYRALTRIANGVPILLTRNRLDWTKRFEPIGRDLAGLGLPDMILDGEIVVRDEDGTTSFGALQDALQDQHHDRLEYYLFDLLFCDGEDLRKRPLSERKARLREIVPAQHPRIHFSEGFEQSGASVYQHACQMALEGIISKRADAPYRSGRSDAWVKSKCLMEQEFILAGYTFQPKHPGELGALLLGYYENGELCLAGKVGTGFNQAMRQDLIARLSKIAQETSPFAAKVPGMYRRGAHWVKPELVAQIRFTQWTDTGSLRHPAFLGLREDKAAREVVREERTKLPPRKAEAPAAKPKKAAPAKEAKALGSKKEKAVYAGVTLSHPDRALWNDPLVTKDDLARYYEAVSAWMLPHVAGRPISLLRCPSGVDAGGAKCFFQRHAGEGGSPHIRQVKVAEPATSEPFLTIDDEAGLMALVQIGVLEIHEWGAMADATDTPDQLVFDFDPHEAVPFERVKEAALELRERLEKLKLQSFLKTTGGKGLHVVAPILPGPGWKEVKAFTQRIAHEMEADAPTRYTSNIRKAERVGRILIDYFRNDHTASSVAPFSTRARPGAPVALPIDWKEMKALKSGAAFTLSTAPRILAKRRSDPWEAMLKLKQKLPKA